MSIEHFDRNMLGTAAQQALTVTAVWFLCACSVGNESVAGDKTPSPSSHSAPLQSQGLLHDEARPKPVLPAGFGREGGLWNDPSVIKSGSGFVMYLTSSIDKPFEPPVVPFRAESPDGIEWKLSPEAPLLETAGLPYASIETPSVVRFNGEYHMYFTGVFGEGSVPSMAIGHAVSQDGIAWKVDAQPVLSATGDSGDWNGYLVAEPGAVVLDGELYLYFTAVGARPGGRPPQYQTIGMSISSDGVRFGEQREVLQQSELYPAESGYAGYSTPSAVLIDGCVHLFFDVARFVEAGQPEWQQVALHHAVSKDGIAGFLQDAAPLLVRNDLSWTSGEILAPTALIDDGQLRIWFSGHVANDQLGPFIRRGLKGDEFGIGYLELPVEEFLSRTAN